MTEEAFIKTCESLCKMIEVLQRSVKLHTSIVTFRNIQCNCNKDQDIVIKRIAATNKLINKYCLSYVFAQWRKLTVFD